MVVCVVAIYVTIIVFVVVVVHVVEDFVVANVFVPFVIRVHFSTPALTSKTTTVLSRNMSR